MRDNKDEAASSFEEKFISANAMPNENGQFDGFCEEYYEELGGDDSRFEFYSPEEEKNDRQKVEETKNKNVYIAHNSYLGGMKDYLVQKKNSFQQNVNGFFEKLNEVER